MEFNIQVLDRIIMDLPNKPLVNTHNNNNNNDHTNSNNSSTTVIKKEEPSTIDEQHIPITANNDSTDRQYCLIIFNNPRWSQHLRKRSSPSSQCEQQQQEQQIKHEPNHTEEGKVFVKNESQDNNSFDDLFIAQLRQLINDYMLRTKRPFPVKYFLDFTTN